MAWSAVTHNFTKDNRIRFCNVTPLNVVYAVNGVDAPAIYHDKTHSDFTAITNYYSSTYVTLVPKIAVFFAGRVYFMHCKVNGSWEKDKFYRSSDIAVGGLPLVWAADEFVSLGDEIVGAGVVGDNLFVGCRQSCWYFTQNDQKFQISSNGCVSHESICAYSKYGFWASRDGMYASVGGDEKKISSAVQDFWDAIPEASLALISAGIDRFNLYISIGDVTVDGETHSNTVLKYNILQNNWTRLYLADEPYSMHQFVTSSGQQLFFGDSAGKVYELGSGGTQNGENIPTAIETDWQYGSGARSVDDFYEFWGVGDKLSGLKVMYKVDSKDNEWMPAGELNGERSVAKFKARGSRIKFLIQETSKSNLFQVDGFVYGYEPAYEAIK